MNPAALINWSELSRLLTGSRSVVTAKRMPKKHAQAVASLKKHIEQWCNEVDICQ